MKFVANTCFLPVMILGDLYFYPPSFKEDSLEIIHYKRMRTRNIKKISQSYNSRHVGGTSVGVY
jgi:hypothetical protein